LESERKEVILNLSDGPAVTPATDEELEQYARDCAGADGVRCASCFVGPAMADCPSFLCRRDVAKLLARIAVLKAERGRAEARLLKLLEDRTPE
jgi:hypothetical protein